MLFLFKIIIVYILQASILSRRISIQSDTTLCVLYCIVYSIWSFYIDVFIISYLYTISNLATLLMSWRYKLHFTQVQQYV